MRLTVNFDVALPLFCVAVEKFDGLQVLNVKFDVFYAGHGLKLSSWAGGHRVLGG